jgi:TRAP-type C4-dicarboxylate transport system permease small subunit
MHLIYRLLEFTVFLFTCALVIIVAAAVFFRYVLHQSLYWGTELPNFLFMWIVFLGAAIAYRTKKHIAFSIFVAKLPPKIRNSVEMFSLLILASFFAFLLVTGIQVCIANIESETEALKISYGIVYACVPISGILMLLDSLSEIWMKVRGKK